MGAIFLRMSKQEITQDLLETQVRIEQVSLQPSLRIAPKVREAKIKVVAEENSKGEMSLSGPFDQPQKIRTR